LPGDGPAAAAAALTPLPPAVALAALRAYARQNGEAALPLLEGLLLDAAAAPLAAAALEALGEVPAPRAAALAARWAGEGTDGAPDESGAPGATGTRETRKAARRALHRLTQAGVQPEHRPRPAPAPQRERPERVRRALMSAADAEGTRLLYLLIDPPLGGAQMARVIASETGGLLRFEILDSTGRQFERYLTTSRPDRELALAEIPPAYARWLIGQAVAAAQAAGRPLPPAYLSFRDSLPSPDVEPVPPIEDEPIYLEVRYRPDLVEQSVELLELPEFRMWLPDQAAVAPLAEEWRNVDSGPLSLPPMVVGQRREAILDRIIDLITGPGGVPGARRRLEDNALVLLRRGETQAARRAIAAASRLDPDDPAAAHSQPLFRAIAETAIEALLGPEATAPPQPAAGEEAAPPPAAPAAPAAPDTPVEDEPGMRRRPSGLILPR